jgi:hypothetical protein
MPHNLSADLAGIDVKVLAHMIEFAATTALFADLLQMHSDALADGRLTYQERHALSVAAAVLSVQADLLSQALEV